LFGHFEHTVPSRKMISALSSIDCTKKLRNLRSFEINLRSRHLHIFPFFLKFYSRKSLKKIEDVYCLPTLCQRSLGECRDCGLRRELCTRAGFCGFRERWTMLSLFSRTAGKGISKCGKTGREPHRKWLWIDPFLTFWENTDYFASFLIIFDWNYDYFPVKSKFFFRWRNSDLWFDF
jgi:hypothetical protein